VRAVIAVAKTLGLSVTGEGVERQDQLEQLRLLGCDRVQGFFVGPPLASEDVNSVLAAAVILPSCPRGSTPPAEPPRAPLPA
jgi:EAL domain-containing protein (putative c-di-GMP-specific phosphodiesterase class I)